MIIGTAGHIDHGKTALVKALTGIETDRLREEKKRGMSIDIGFAHIDFPDGTRAGIIDVPGHENFIRNMIAGAQGVDLFMLLVAADDGIMPQTREHLDIIELLDVHAGIVVITKIDAVDTHRVEEVRRAVRDLLHGRAFGAAPILPVSSRTGEGIGALKRELEGICARVVRKRGDKPFRMPIDRSFTIKGFGTVVTGTVASGIISAGEKVRLFPGGRELKIRNLQSYGTNQPAIGYGERCAVNLSGIDKGMVRRGNLIVSCGLTRDTLRVDAKIRSVPFSDKEIRSGERIHLHTGTADIIASIYPLTAKTLTPPFEEYVRMKLSKPLHIMRGDRFIVRNYSAQNTLAGGVVLNPFPPKVRKSEKAAFFSSWDRDDAASLCRDILLRKGSEDIERLAENIFVDPAALFHILDRSGDFYISGNIVFLQEDTRKLKQHIGEYLQCYHRSNPSSGGIEPETVRSRLAPGFTLHIFRKILDDLFREGVVERNGNLIRLKCVEASFSHEEAKDRSRILSVLKEKGYQTASLQVITGSERKIKDCLYSLVKEKKVTQVSRDNFVLADLLDEAKGLMLDHFRRKKTLSVVEFKDILGTGRKGAILILEYFDNLRLTQRKGDERILLKGL